MPAVCLSRAAWVLWYLGYPDQGLTRSHAAVTLAQQTCAPLQPHFCLECCCHVPSVPP